MRPSTFDSLVQQIHYLLPGLIVYLGGMAIAASYLRRYPKPAGIALAACVLLLGLEIGVPILQALLFESLSGKWYTNFQIGGRYLYAAAMGLLVWAVFVDRRPRFPPDYFESGGRDEQARRKS
jgi:hypothetical protein